MISGSTSTFLKTVQSRARVNWVAQYTFSATGRPVKNHVTTEMQLVAGKIVRQEDTFSLWRWSSQALGAKGSLLGWTPFVRNKIRAQASAALRDFARKVAPDLSIEFGEPQVSVASTTINGVARIQITRPEKKNAITAAMYQSMADAIGSRAMMTQRRARF